MCILLIPSYSLQRKTEMCIYYCEYETLGDIIHLLAGDINEYAFSQPLWHFACLGRLLVRFLVAGGKTVHTF